MKLITNGMETKDIAWYLTYYITKKRKESSNTSALLAKTFAFHSSNKIRNTELVTTNKLLLQRCANTLSREQELSGPEVVNYIMGWGDRYISHHFVTIPWYSMPSSLQKAFPVLRKQR